MQIHVVGDRSKWPGNPSALEGVGVSFVQPPARALTRPASFVLGLRSIKRCMILYWIDDEETRFALPRLLAPFARGVVKLPGGPAIVVQSESPDTPLRAFADFVVSPKDDHQAVMKRAFFHAECGHPKSIYRERIQKDRVRWLKSRARGRILEIGCATGHLLDYLGGGVGLDMDEMRLEYARGLYPSSQFICADAAQMPFADREFDTVLIPDILEHVPFEHAKKIVREASRVGKRLVVTVPNAGKPHYNKDLVENPEHLWFPTEALLRELSGGQGSITHSTWDDFLYLETEQ